MIKKVGLVLCKPVVMFLFLLVFPVQARLKNEIFRHVVALSNVIAANMQVTENVTINGNLAVSGSINNSEVVKNQGAATTNAVARFEDSADRLIKNSPVLADDSGNITINGITKNGKTVSWPTGIGPSGALLISDGNGNLNYVVVLGVAGATGPMGPTGPKGATGAEGPKGPTGVSFLDWMIANWG